jgi:hypothetical protein
MHVSEGIRETGGISTCKLDRDTHCSITPSCRTFGFTPFGVPASPPMMSLDVADSQDFLSASTQQKSSQSWRWSRDVAGCGSAFGGPKG